MKPLAVYTLVLALVIVVLAMVVWTTARYHHSVEHRKFLDGFWQAPQDFCDSSGIKNAYAYIQADTIYLLVEDDHGVLVDSCIAHNFSLHNTGDTTSEYGFSTRADIAPLPQTMTARVSPGDGFLAFYHGDVIQLQLYKVYMQ